MISPEIKRILSELKPHKKLLIIVASSGVTIAIADTINANLIKYVFDGLQAGKAQMIIGTIGWILLWALIKNIARYYHMFNMNYISELVAQGYRQQLQRKFMDLNLTFHNTYQAGAGGLISRILGDIMNIFQGLRLFADFFREPLLFIGLISTLFYLNWKLTATILLVLPLVLWFLRQVSRSVKKYSAQGQEDLEKVTGTIKETLDGVRIIQSFNLENEMAKRFVDQSKDFIESRRKTHSRMEITGPVTEYVMTIVVFLIVLYMTLEIAAGRATYGDFMSYLSSLLMLSGPIKKMQESYIRIQETTAAAARAYQILDEKSEVPQGQATKKFPTDWKKIEYKNVSFRYGQDWILKNINLTLNRGNMIAFVGASGSGKSTVVNLLGRFFDPTEGQIFIDDIPISQIELKELRKNIALVTQDVFLFSDTIERNIWAGDFSQSNDRVVSSAKAANAHDFIEKTALGYKNRVGERGNLLSGGEKQRISIARAVFKDAPILILDEATSALDSKSEIEVQKGLDFAMQGRTSLVIAHRLATIARADIIHVFKQGEIIESGKHQDLLSHNGEYNHLYQLQYNH